MVRKLVLEQDEIVSGKQLPFSIFDPSRNLLLAVKGQMVTERTRAALLRNGLIAFSEEEDDVEPPRTVDLDAHIPPLLRLRMLYAPGSASTRSAFRISREDGDESHTCRVIGSTDHRGMMLSAPLHDDGSHVAISEGQRWLFRTLYSTAAIRFTSTIGKIVSDPFPYFHIEVPPLVDMRHVRKVQRVAICLNAVLRLSQPTEAVIVDLSTTGMQIAADSRVELQKGYRFKTEFRVIILDKAYDLSVDTDVVRCLGAIDPRHPKICFYGFGFEGLSDFNRLLLHASVQSCVIRELDGLSKMLTE